MAASDSRKKRIKAATHGQGSVDMRWYLDDEVNPSRVEEALNFIQGQQSWREDYYRGYANLYGDAALGDSTIRLYDRPVSVNVIKNLCDTIHARITRDRPAVTVQTEGANWAAQRKAKGLGKFIDGVFHDSGIYRQAPQAFLDAAVFGTGCLFAAIDNGRVVAERVYPGEVWCEEGESLYEDPRTLYRERFYDRQVLLDLAGTWLEDEPERLERAQSAIHSATGGPSQGRARQTSGDTQVDLVRVIEVWRLPSGTGAGDGRHCIVVGGASGGILADEEWDSPRFPAAFIRYSRKLRGFWGSGIPEEILPLQREINKLARFIQDSHHLGAAFKIFVPDGEVPTAHIDNDIGTIYQTRRGAEPKVYVAPTVHPEIYKHFETLYRKCFEVTGISQNAAQGQKPAGLDSGKALRLHHDMENERFVDRARQYENLFLDLARVVVDMGRKLKDDGGLSVKVPGKKFIESVDFGAVDLDDNLFEIKVFPTSMLPKTPEGRIAMVEELLGAGVLGDDPSLALELLDMPDLEKVVDGQTSGRRVAEDAVSSVLERGVLIQPEPIWNLALCRKVAVQAHMEHTVKYRDEDGEADPELAQNLGLLLDYVSAIDRLLDMAAKPPEAAPPPMPPDGMTPMPDPGALPPGPMPPPGATPPDMPPPPMP